MRLLARKCPTNRVIERRLVFDDAASLAAEGKCASEHDGQADFGRRSANFVWRLAGPASGSSDVDLGQALDEERSVFRIANRLDRCTEHVNAVLLEHTAVVKGEAAVQCGLTSEREHDRIDLFLDDDSLDELRCHRHQVDSIGKLGAGLDRRYVGVYQNGLDPLFLERLDRLRPGVVELAGLTDL